MKNDFISRFLCFDFLTDHNLTIEFRICQVANGLSVEKGVHEDQRIPRFETVSFHQPDLRSAFVYVFEELRKLEIESGIYPDLQVSNITLDKNYQDAIENLIYSHEHLRFDHFSTFEMYGNKMKLPNHLADWEYWRPYREQLQKHYGFVSLDPYRAIEFENLMKAELVAVI